MMKSALLFYRKLVADLTSIILVILSTPIVYVLFLIITRCTYVSTNFGRLRPTYSYVDLCTKMSVS